METHEILEKALEFFEDHEWIQDAAFLLPDGTKTSVIPDRMDMIKGACLEGACHTVRSFPVSEEYGRALCLMELAARDLFPDRMLVSGDSVALFNDHLQTTREDALLVLKHAIEFATSGTDVADPSKFGTNFLRAAK